MPPDPVDVPTKTYAQSGAGVRIWSVKSKRCWSQRGVRRAEASCQRVSLRHRCFVNAQGVRSSCGIFCPLILFELMLIVSLRHVWPTRPCWGLPHPLQGLAPPTRHRKPSIFSNSRSTAKRPLFQIFSSGGFVNSEYLQSGALCSPSRCFIFNQGVHVFQPDVFVNSN